MATVTLRIRHDVRRTGPGGDTGAVRRRRVQAFPEEVNLDQLTPRARALAEALTDAQGVSLPGNWMTVVQESHRTVREINPDWEAYGTLLEPDQLATRTIEVQRMRADDERTASQWLEHEATSHGDDWYTVSASRGDRVSSWEAAAADIYLTKDQLLERLRGTPAELGITGWDTLRATSILAPDRHVDREPQWRPQTVDAFIDRPRDLWPISQVGAYLGIGTASARVQMRRWGFLAEGRAPGRGGESLYPADLIEAAHTNRPKRGRRPKSGIEMP